MKADFGTEFLDGVGRKAREISEPQVQALQNQVGQLQNQIARDGRNRMMETLDRDIPHWREMNERPEFLEALGRQDEQTGYTYHQWLKKHWNENNTQLVKNFFQKASDDMGYGKPAPSSNFPVVRCADNTVDRGHPGQQGRIITRQMIAKHHDDIVRGRYVGRDKERREMDEAICAASRDGRIR
jgi:hypothetical protein